MIEPSIQPTSDEAGPGPSPEVARIDWSAYDFIDLGCSNGGSIRHCLQRFSVERGIGVDIDARKVERTRAAGFDAVIADARSLDVERAVSFVTMLDFFEHLPDLGTVEEILAAAARSARDFIYIKHPSFEGQEHAEADGLRQYWWNWHGHTAHVRVADYCSMFDRLGLSAYMIRYVERIDDSSHPCIVPIDAPQDLSAADAAEETDVKQVHFSPPLWRRQDIFIALRPFSASEWAEVTRPTPQDHKVMVRSGQIPAAGDGSYGHLRPVRRKVTPAA